MALSSLAADPVAPGFGEADIANARGMLRLARAEVVKEFHDPARIGPAFDNDCAAAERSLSRARSNGEALMMIAQVFLNIGDSHTMFFPPGRRDDVKHGWEFGASGDGTYVTRVEPDSDAAAKGLRVGDKLLLIDGIEPRPVDNFRLQYLLYLLVPRPGMRVIVQAPGQQPRQLDIAAKVTRRATIRDITPQSGGIYEYILEGERDDEKQRSRFVSLPGDILVWKLNRFDDKKVPAGLRRAGSAKAVVLDLRGNPGGRVDSCHDLLRGFLDGKFPAYTEVGRSKSKDVSLSGRGTFSGPLFVLIDNRSSSASEVFAALIQIRKRGVLLGERSGGNLTTAKYYPLEMGTAQKLTLFGVMVGIGKMVMPDGSIIEGHGVMPDEVDVPTHEDLYTGRDPALARAITLAGHAITPEAAGKLFPRED